MAWVLLPVAFALVAGCGDAKPSAPTDSARPASHAAVARIVIARIQVDQPIVEGKVDAATHTMVAPADPFDIAYYSYSARPGQGNAVFSGHVDYRDVGPAVFWNLDKLIEGDSILVRLADGSEFRYAVRFNNVYDAATGPWQELFGVLAVADGITVYTCSGDFDPPTRTYDKRRVVRAERVG